MISKVLMIGEPLGLFIAQNEGTLETAQEYTTAVAGSEFDVAVGLNRLGHAVGFMTKLGNDPFGHQIVNVMNQNHMDTSLILINSDHDTGFMLKSKVTSGLPEIFYHRNNSAASTISPDDIGRIDLQEFDYVYLTGVFPALSSMTLEAAKVLVQRAKACGLTVFFDPVLCPQLWSDKSLMIYLINELAFMCDYFLPGVKEGTVLTGGLTTPEAIASYYQVRGILNVIIKVSPAKAYLATKNEHKYLPLHEIEKAAEPSGGGEGFAVGVISAMMEGLPIRAAVNRGIAVSCMQMMSDGEYEGFPDREQMEAFMREYRLNEFS